MNKFYLKAASALFMASLAMNVSAQQIPNGGFEGDIVFPKIPWQTIRPELASQVQFTEETRKSVAEKAEFYMPELWDGSNNLGAIASGNSYNNPIRTIMMVDGGHNSATSVTITDKNGEVIESLKFPGYISLGTAWFGADFTQAVNLPPFLGGSKPATCSNQDWGTFGGAEFTAKPDAISFYYKREGATQDATVVAYLWKGTYTQVSVPALIGNPGMHVNEGEYPTYGPLPAINMENRDRAILGMETATGKEITKSDDAELIASAVARISETPSEWTLFECPLEYKSQATPEKINIIIAAGDYFGANGDFVDGNSITVDDITAVYYSRLKSITVGNYTKELEAGVYTYDVAADYPATNDDFDVEAWGQGAQPSKKFAIRDDANKTISVMVANVNGNDIDGQQMHTYTFKFTGAETPEPGEGNLTIDLWRVTAVSSPSKYDEKVGSMTGNISYDATTKYYTINDFLGYKNANLTFWIEENGTPENQVALGGGVKNPYKSNIEDHTDEYTYIVRVVMPEASDDRVINPAQEWGEDDPKSFVLKLSDEPFDQKNIKPEFASGVFKGEETDYMLLNPTFGGHWGTTEQIRLSSMRGCHAVKIDGKWSVRMYCKTTTVNQKAASATEWEWNRETYRLDAPLIMFTIPTDLGAGVEGIEIENGIDENAPVEYYNLQGIKVENPAAGLYIKRQGNKVEKVIIR